MPSRPAIHKKHTLAKESLNQSTIRPTVMPADVERFQDGHESHDCVEKERRDLQEFSTGLRSSKVTAYKEAYSNKRIIVNSTGLISEKDPPSRCAECGFDIGKQGPLS